MGRPAKPVELHLANGNKRHLTNEEKQRRKDGEIKIGKKKFLCPVFVQNDKFAYEKWKEIIDLYRDVDFVSNGDTGHLARYCKTFSEYLNLIDRMSHIKNISEDSNDIDEYIDEHFDDRIKKQLMDMVSTSAILQLETAINKKQDMLIKMEDRLFLNPLAKVRNVPKKPETPKDPLKEQGFGNV